jgi:hypothetical protein
MVNHLILRAGTVFASLSLVFGCYSELNYREKSGRMHYIANYGCDRLCSCVKNVNTHNIYKSNSVSTKAFSSSDCTGNYDEIEDEITNGEWVNSISFGPKGTSVGPFSCPSSFPY